MDKEKKNEEKKLKIIIKKQEEEIADLKKQIDNMKVSSAAEMKNRDRIIDETKRNNTLLLKTALNQSKKNEELKSLILKLRSRGEKK